MKKFINIYSKYLLVSLFIFVILISPKYTLANFVPIDYISFDSYDSGGSGNAFRSSWGMTLCKQFILQAEGIRNLNFNESGAGDIPNGVNLRAYNYPVMGSYHYMGATYGTPPMDDMFYGYGGTGWNSDTDSYDDSEVLGVGIDNRVRAGISSQLEYILSSDNSNIINCSSGYECTTVGSGIATVTVSFPGSGLYYLEQRDQVGDRFFTRAYEYTLSSIDYVIRVNNPNQIPTAKYTSTSNLDYNTATANWTYIDADGDAQTDIELKVYTNSNYTNGQVFTGSATGADIRSLNITGLKPGTTYYPTVKVRDSKGAWSGWSNGDAFTTKANNPPNLGELSCGGTGKGYTGGNINWNYTGTDEPGDELILKARWKRPEDGVWTVVELPYNTRTGNIDISELISGYAYDIQVYLNDNRNSSPSVTDPLSESTFWKECGTLTPPNYPDPVVDFKLNKQGEDLSKSKTNGERLVLKTGDKVNANWSINNGTEVGLQSCALSTTGGIDLDGEQDFIDSLVGTGFSGNVNNKQVPTILEDTTYFVKLICPGKQAKTVKSVNQIINLEVQSYPIITSCDVNKNTVKAGQTNVNITAQVGNVSSYSWEVKRDINDVSNISSVNSPIPNPITLNYAGTEFGRYTPWLKVTRSGTTRSDERTCGTVANLGDSNIREINP